MGKRATAYHEAGHAIVRWALPLPKVLRITIEAQDDYLGHVSPFLTRQRLPQSIYDALEFGTLIPRQQRRLNDQAATIWAGALAEQRATGTFNRGGFGVTDDEAGASWVALGSDADVLAEWGLRLFADEADRSHWFDETRGRAGALLAANWQAVATLADYLLEVRTIWGPYGRSELFYRVGAQGKPVLITNEPGDDFGDSIPRRVYRSISARRE